MDATTNGKPRKQLSDQLDRLDGIIDLLAERLNDACADAARDGARAAVRELAAELMANPDVLALVRGLATPAREPAPRAGWWSAFKAVAATALGGAAAAVRDVHGRAKALVASAATRVQAAVVGAAATVAEPVVRVREAVGAVRAVARSCPSVRTTAVVGLLVGAGVIAVAATSHALAAGLAGSAAGCVAAGARVALRFRAAAFG